MNDIDINDDGKITSSEQLAYEKKAINRRRMAWVSLVSLVLSGFAVMFLVPESRIDQLNGILEIYFISLASIVGAYVGISTWMTKK